MENFNFKWRERTEKDYVLPEDANLLAEGIKETQKAFENYATPPTKMSELEQDLTSLKFKNGIMTYSDTGIKPSGMSTFGINAFNLSISGHEISISGNVDSDKVHISNLVTPKTDTDAANKKYVDDITGDISTALDTIIAMQSQYMGVSE